MLIPLENKRPKRCKDTETFSESSADLFSPIGFEAPVFLAHPRGLAAERVRRIEHNQGECPGRKGKRREISDQVWIDDDMAPAFTSVGVANLATFIHE